MAKDYSAKATDVKNFTQSSEVNLPQNFQDYSEFLPNINRSESLQRFFGATVNQLLSSGSTQSIDAYWGRLAGRNYNPNSELFQPETEALRQNYQFQPGIANKNGDTLESTVSYINWLKRLESLGADLNNHDRLFSEPGYVLDLPINIDMFVNYSNYFWLEGSIPLIEIEATVTDPIDIDDITKLAHYTTPLLGNYKQVEFVTGLRVKFTGDYVTSTSGDYTADSIYYVENVGGKGGIKLVEIVDPAGNNLFPSITPYQIEPREGWDTVDWDTTPWDGIAAFEDYEIETTEIREDLSLNKSYIVMERWSSDKNPWARTNRWFSLYALQTAVEYNDLDLEAYLNIKTRADRPIIEFRANMELFNSGGNFVETVDYVVSLDQVTTMLSGVEEFFVDSENAIQDGDIILVAKEEAGGIEIVEYNSDFSNDFDSGVISSGPFGTSFSSAFNIGVQSTFYEAAFTVSGVGSNITLTPYNTYGKDEYVIVAKGTEKGSIYYFKNGLWSVAQNKETRGDFPLFNLYDQFKQPLDGFDNNDFNGDKVFGYVVNSAGQFDRELGFTPAFTDQGSFSNYRFEWTLSNNRYNKDVTVLTSEEIRGYYFWKDRVRDEYYNGWSNMRGGQRVPIIQTTICDGVTQPSFKLGTANVQYPTEYTVLIEQSKYRWYDHSYIDRNSIGYVNPELIWKYDTEYTINDLISVDANKLEFVSPVNYSLNVLGITLNATDPVEITVSDTSELSTGEQVTINNVTGTIELNGNTYTITVLDSTTIQLNGTDSSLFSPYTANGNVTYLGVINSIVFTEISDVLKTVTITSDYPYTTVLYRDLADPDNYGEIHLSNDNQNRVNVARNGQILDDGIDYEIVGTTLTVLDQCEENDVIELMYIADADLENVVYDVAPVHFYNSQNNPFTSAGYDDLINHFSRQVSMLPGFDGDAQGLNNYHRSLRLHTYDGLIRQQIFRTSHIQYLLDQEDINPIRALKTFALDYSNFKRTFRNKVRQLWMSQSWSSVRDLVDKALTDINIGKGEEFKYAHSDMAYYKKFKSFTYAIDPDNPATIYELPEPINKYGDTRNHVQVWLSEFVLDENKTI